MTRELRPIRIEKKFYDEVDQHLKKFFFDTLFKPVIESMKQSKKIYFNAVTKYSEIEKAIKSGRIQYSDNIIKGNFNASITKEFRKLGMKYDKRIDGYRKELFNLPVNIQIAISQTESSYKKMAGDMIKALDLIDINGSMKDFATDTTYERVIKNIDDSFVNTVTKTVGLNIDLTKEQKRNIAKEYSNNLNLFVKDFSEGEVLKMRKQVEEAVFSGIRAESLQNIIQDRFEVSASKAKFLAKQEINLLTSTYKTDKYLNVGITKYKWSTSKIRTRPDHQALDGKIFSYEDKPITNRSTGARNNPGEDFGCNCIDIPQVN